MPSRFSSRLMRHYKQLPEVRQDELLYRGPNDPNLSTREAVIAARIYDTDNTYFAAREARKKFGL